MLLKFQNNNVTPPCTSSQTQFMNECCWKLKPCFIPLHMLGTHSFPFEFNPPEAVPASVDWHEGKQSKASAEDNFDAFEGKYVFSCDLLTVLAAVSLLLFFFNSMTMFILYRNGTYSPPSSPKLIIIITISHCALTCWYLQEHLCLAACRASIKYSVQATCRIAGSMPDVKNEIKSKIQPITLCPKSAASPTGMLISLAH